MNSTRFVMLGSFSSLSWFESMNKKNRMDILWWFTVVTYQ